MNGAPQPATLIVAIIAMLCSGASALIAWRATHPRPQLHGRLLTAYYIGVSGDFNGTAVIVPCIVTNSTKEPIHVMGYRMSVKIKAGWVDLRRFVTFSMPTLTVSDTWEVKMTPENFLDRAPRQVEFGAPLLGFLGFFHTERLVEDDVIAYRITLIDIFDREHVLTLDGKSARLFKQTSLMNDPGIRPHELFRLVGAEVSEISKKQKEAGEPEIELARQSGRDA
jgi:hypothetical protein